jgi:glycosyltransferase involved in cell wall biosynthesis
MAARSKATSGGGPELSVVVPTHGRPLRLRWLLNALEEQSLPAEEFEVVVVHDGGEEVAELLASHPLGPRELVVPGASGPATKRNEGWRAARAGTVVFTDDDCRPPVEWLAQMLRAVRAADGAIVQGATRPDPDERLIMLRAPRWRTQDIDPPTVWAQTCNIAYPRDVLERLGGFDDSLPEPAGEDTELAVRARKAGTGYVGAPDALTFHAVEDMGLIGRVRVAWRWGGVAYVMKLHPELRREAVLGVFWKKRHAWLLLAILGVLGLRRSRLMGAALVVPYVVEAMPSGPSNLRGRVKGALLVPGTALIDLAEMGALARASVRHRTFFL